MGGPDLIFELSAGTVTDKGVTPATAAAGIVLEALKDFGDAGAKDSEWKAAAGVDSGQLSRSRYYDVKRDLLENGIATRRPGGKFAVAKAPGWRGGSDSVPGSGPIQKPDSQGGHDHGGIPETRTNSEDSQSPSGPIGPGSDLAVGWSDRSGGSSTPDHRTNSATSGYSDGVHPKGFASTLPGQGPHEDTKEEGSGEGAFGPENLSSSASGSTSDPRTGRHDAVGSGCASLGARPLTADEVQRVRRLVRDENMSYEHAREIVVWDGGYVVS